MLPRFAYTGTDFVSTEVCQGRFGCGLLYRLDLLYGHCLLYGCALLYGCDI